MIRWASWFCIWTSTLILKDRHCKKKKNPKKKAFCMGEESMLRHVTKNVLLFHMCVYVCVSVAYAHWCTYLCVNADVRGGLLVLSSNTCSFGTVFLIEPEAYVSLWLDWQPRSPRDLHISTPLVLGLQEWARFISLLHGYWYLNSDSHASQ